MSKLVLLRNVRPNAGARADILIKNGRISKIGATIPPDGGDATVLDGGGDIALPGLIEAHTHMDKTFLGLPWQPHSAGPSIREKVDNERQLVKKLKIDSARQSATQARLEISKGSTHIRTHVDVNGERGIGYLEGVLETRQALEGKVTIQTRGVSATRRLGLARHRSLSERSCGPRR
jgi:cytosine/adenosine deaminase-related metal-dependent hydrolase